MADSQGCCISCRNFTRKWTYHHIIMFLLTYFGYALFHATRKTFSNVKTMVEKEWVPTNTSSHAEEFLDRDIWNQHHLFENTDDAQTFLGELDTIFMTFYALGLFFSGYIADRLNMRIVLSVGMWLSAASMIAFGVVSEWFHIYNKAWYIFFWMLNGLFQSVGWPVTVTVVENWFGKSSRGLMFGVWGSCTSIGNIVGAYLTVAVLDYGYEFAFLVSSSVLFAGGIIIFFSLVSSPEELGLPLPDEEPEAQAALIAEEDEPLMNWASTSQTIDTSFKVPDRERAIGFFQAFLLPGVALYSFSYACLKMVNYSFFFWLPYYLNHKFHWSDTVADQLSVWYDVGGIIGAVISGIITDRIGRRSVIVMIMLFISPFVLFGYYESPDNEEINALLMVICGIFINGVANILSTAIAADLGRQDALKGNSKAMATVTGIVDGTGSIGAALGQMAIPALSIAAGWDSVFILFIVMTILTAVFILPIFINDLKYYRELYKSRRETRRSDQSINGAGREEISDS